MLIQDMHDGLMRVTFPHATEVELYASSITYHQDGSMTLRCGGKEVKMPMVIHLTESAPQDRS